MDDRPFDLFSKIITVISFLMALYLFLVEIWKRTPDPRSATGGELLAAVITIGLVASIIHGVLWHMIELKFGWKFGAGGGESMPEGYQAVILSITLIFPLAILPPLYQSITGKQVVPERHYIAAGTIFVTAAIGHLIMYGINTPKIPGLKELIYPVGTIVSLPRALFAEFVYAVVYFSAIVLVYRLVIGSNNWIIPYTVSLFLWFFAITSYICLMYPESITDKTWVQVRGVLSALGLEIALIGGMLMRLAR